MGTLHSDPLDNITKAVVEGYDHTCYWKAKELNRMTLSRGFNKFKFNGLEKLVPGKVQLEAWDGSTEVADSKLLCNHQFEIVGLAA
jgi:hypothetical protein